MYFYLIIEYNIKNMLITCKNVLIPLIDTNNVISSWLVLIKRLFCAWAVGEMCVLRHTAIKANQMLPDFLF